MHDATTMNDDDDEGDGEVIKKPQSTEVGGDLTVEMADNDKRDWKSEQERSDWISRSGRMEKQKKSCWRWGKDNVN